MQLLFDFIFGQPLEVREAKLVVVEVRLPGHDPSLHEKDLLSKPLGACLFVEDLLRVDNGSVPNRHVADDPGVHVRARGLHQYSFRCLRCKNISVYYMSLEFCPTHRIQTLVHF